MSLSRPRLSILAKLALAYTVPAIALFALFGLVTYELSRRDLEAELGRRLAAVAAVAATQIRGYHLADLAPGEENGRAYLNTQRKLEAVRQRTGVGRVYVFRPDFTSLCDTHAGTAIGERNYTLELDRHELSRVFARGESVSSLLFRGHDGAFYKAGYAPVVASEDDPTIVAGLGVEAPAGYFARLVALKRTIITYGAALLAAVLAASVFVATRLTRPLRALAREAERIGQGDLSSPIAETGRDEIGVLGHTLEEMRQALSARDERMQMMLAGIAHEVRNPLGGIELYAGLLADDLAGDAEKLGHVTRIQRELGHLGAVVTDFLEYARRPKPDLVPTDIAPLFDEVRDAVSADAERGAVTVHVSVVPPARALADPGQLRRALLNLARNALQATPPGGTVTLSSRPAPPGLHLQVSDTGTGIPPADLSKIFTPFYTTREKGTGLGLAFVREIAVDHRGTIHVESEPARGTTFTLELEQA